jgi:hypothetical protein
MSRSLICRLANLSAAAAGLLLWLLWRYPPETSSRYPRCPVFTWLHFYCPGCGATRAMAALLHGRVGEAFHWNGLFVLLLPFALAFLAASYWRANRSAEFRWPVVPDAVLTVVLALAGIFTVVRNIPKF